MWGYYTWRYFSTVYHAWAQVPKLKPQPGLINIASYTTDTCLRAGMQNHYYVVSHSIRSLWISLCCVSLLHCLKGEPSSSLWTYPASPMLVNVGEGYKLYICTHDFIRKIAVLSLNNTKPGYGYTCSSFEKMNLAIYESLLWLINSNSIQVTSYVMLLDLIRTSNSKFYENLTFCSILINHCACADTLLYWIHHVKFVHFYYRM